MLMTHVGLLMVLGIFAGLLKQINSLYFRIFRLFSGRLLGVKRKSKSKYRVREAKIISGLAQLGFGKGVY